MVRHLCRSLILVLAATAPATAAPQWLPRPFLSIDNPGNAPPAQEASVAGPTGAGPAVALGLVGGALGAVAGYAVGYPLVYQPSRERDLRRGCEDCGLGGAIGTMALMALGETIGVAVGAHLGNASGGNLGPTSGPHSARWCWAGWSRAALAPPRSFHRSW